MRQKAYITVPQLAQKLGVSRTAVYRKVKRGQISARLVGRTYIIPAREAESVISGGLTAKDKRLLRALVTKTVSEYGLVLEWLSKV